MDFSRYLVTERKVSTSHQNQAINAIKFYFEKVKGGERKFYHIVGSHFETRPEQFNDHPAYGT
jgi:hypothetical protein